MITIEILGTQLKIPANRDIAIIGMSGRFPGADEPSGIRRLLREGRHALRPIPKEWAATVALQPGFMDSDCANQQLVHFAYGEAEGYLLLKQADKARADGDHIYAVIKGLVLAAPVTPQNISPEQLLKDAFAAVLHREAVQDADDFFRLGGDSFKVVAVAGYLHQQGYRIDLRDVFQYPTVGDLAPFVQPVIRLADQSPVTGRVPLTPEQIAFFTRNSLKSGHYNHVLQFDAALGSAFELDALQEALNLLTDHHDALRLAYTFDKYGVRQENAQPGQYIDIKSFDFTNTPGPMRWFTETVSSLQAGIDLSGGPMLCAAHFKLPEDERFVVIVHHLLADELSAGIIKEDFNTLLQQQATGEAMRLPHKTVSFQSWSRQLQKFAQSPELLFSIAHWQGVEQTLVPPLPRDDEEGSNTVADAATATFCLEAAQTDSLLTAVHDAYATKTHDLLLAALTKALWHTFNNSIALISLEGHGRGPISDNPDVCRTVGAFTCRYPVVIDFTFQEKPEQQIKTAKEATRAVPGNGLSYGVLKYLTPEALRQGLTFNQNPQIVFNYLGNVPEEATATEPDPREDRLYDLAVTGFIRHGQLHLDIIYSQKQYETATIEALAQHCQQALTDYIAHCTGADTSEHTPGDFGYDQLSLDDMDSFFDD